MTNCYDWQIPIDALLSTSMFNSRRPEEHFLACELLGMLMVLPRTSPSGNSSSSSSSSCLCAHLCLRPCPTATTTSSGSSSSSPCSASCCHQPNGPHQSPALQWAELVALYPESQ